MRHVSSISLSFRSKIPNHAAWRYTRGFQGHSRGQDDIVAPLQPPFQRAFRVSTLLDLLKVRPLSPRRADSDSIFPFATSSPVSSGAFPFSTLFRLARLSSSSSPTPVIGWFLASLSCYFHTVVLRL